MTVCLSQHLCPYPLLIPANWINLLCDFTHYKACLQFVHRLINNCTLCPFRGQETNGRIKTTPSNHGFKFGLSIVQWGRLFCVGPEPQMARINEIFGRHSSEDPTGLFWLQQYYMMSGLGASVFAENIKNPVDCLAQISGWQCTRSISL